MTLEKTIPLFKVFMSEAASKNVSEVLSSGYITQGPEVDKFEDVLKKYFNNENVVTTNSATSALHLVFHMLKEYGLGEDKIKIESEKDHVLSTPLTCTATNWPIVANNINLRWVDVDPSSCNMSLDNLEEKLNKNTKAVLVVHWGGYPVDLDRLQSIQNNFNEKYGFKFVIIEDSAHAFGTNAFGRQIGNTGNISTFSFQAIKHLTSIDGGCINFNNSEDTEKAKLLRWYGIDRNENRKDFRCESDIQNIGFKFHMNDVNAYIGRMNFQPVTEDLLQIHISNGKYYNEELKDVDNLELMDYSNSFQVPYWIYTIKVKKRDAFMKHMERHNIIVSRVHERNDKHTAMAAYQSDLPLLDSFVDEMVCIPVGWWVGEEERFHIVETIKKGW
jgi:dTDP-4-amino-4,6-dideoxygalactose transaminase